MSRPLQIAALNGTYVSGTNLLPVIQTTIANTLSSIGITGTGLPQIFIQGIIGTSTSGITIALSQYANLIALQNLANNAYSFETGIYNDDIAVPIDRLVMTTDTPSASATIRMNCYYEPISKTI